MPKGLMELEAALGNRKFLHLPLRMVVRVEEVISYLSYLLHLNLILLLITYHSLLHLQLSCILIYLRLLI